MAELSTLNIKSVYNQVYPLQKVDWSREVTEESQKAFIFVLLTSSHGTNTESQLLIQIWRELARKFGDLKFCQIRGDLCIDGYPDRNTPTVLVYKNGDVKKQIVTLRELKGSQTTIQGMSISMLEFLFKTTATALQQRYETMATCKSLGANSRNSDVERLLVDIGAVKVGDHRLRRSSEEPVNDAGSRLKSSSKTADDDDDWN
jgi:hypothetical protein